MLLSRDTDNAHHGVLAHQDDTLATQRDTDLVHLLRRDIVDGDDEDGLVLLEQALELVEVAGLVSALAPHIVLRYRIFKDLVLVNVLGSEKGRCCVAEVSSTREIFRADKFADAKISFQSRD